MKKTHALIYKSENGHKPDTLLNVYGTMCDKCPMLAVVRCCGWYWCEKHATEHDKAEPKIPNG